MSQFFASGGQNIGASETQPAVASLKMERGYQAKEWMLLNCGVEKTLENPLDCKEIKPVNSKRTQS